MPKITNGVMIGVTWMTLILGGFGMRKYIVFAILFVFCFGFTGCDNEVILVDAGIDESYSNPEDFFTFHDDQGRYIRLGMTRDEVEEMLEVEGVQEHGGGFIYYLTNGRLFIRFDEVNNQTYHITSSSYSDLIAYDDIKWHLKNPTIDMQTTPVDFRAFYENNPVYGFDDTRGFGDELVAIKIIDGITYERQFVFSERRQEVGLINIKIVSE